MRAAVHAENFGINFRSAEDEYVQCQAEAATPWNPGNVQPEVGGFGAAPVSVVKSAEGLWICNFKLPPGLAAGWHSVRVRTEESEWSNTVRIAVDIPEHAVEIEIAAACDGLDWTPGQFSLRHRRLSLWVRGLPENADRANVKVELSGAAMLRCAQAIRRFRRRCRYKWFAPSQRACRCPHWAGALSHPS